MNTGIYESILQGLNEAIATEKGHLRAKRCKMTVQPPEEFDAEEIRTIRLNANMTQKVFASFLGVSPKTVESWEAGRYKPDGPARRVMGLLQQDHMLAQKYGLISQ
ncbi:MAG: helix-turn-helix domain-containing protein [Ruthenibacterium lactatiformans]|jgi:predicted transcriptional regulator|uniref:helix-turn-helix domain-containing protein n=1 Tax=Ruthenibacterium lactatiformans TaxID=1550024 RepID=UPI003993486F